MPDLDLPRTQPAASEWTRLRADAGRVALGHPGHPAEHHPRVAVIACSDARVPPSVVFDRPSGDLFVVRLAGNTASATAVASVEYAVDHLGVDLLVVLGHTGCGAVAAAIDGACDDTLAPVVAPICAVVAEHPDADADEISRRNVEATMRAVPAASPVIATAVAEGRLEIRGAVYDLTSGELDEVATDLRSRPDPSIDFPSRDLPQVEQPSTEHPPARAQGSRTPTLETP